jgi:hypothetical protein
MNAACFGGKTGTSEESQDGLFEYFYRARRLGASVPHPPAPKDSPPTKRGFLSSEGGRIFLQGVKDPVPGLKRNSVPKTE